MLTLMISAVEPSDVEALTALVTHCDVLDLLDVPTNKVAALALAYTEALRNAQIAGALPERVANLLHAIVVLGYEPVATA